MKEVMNFAGKSVRINNNSVLCDPAKLEKCLKERGLGWAEASRTIGYTNRALQTAAKGGVLSGMIVKGLEIRFNIKLEDYQFIPAPEPEEGSEENEPLPGQIGMDEIIQTGADDHLAAVIKQAIQEAFEAHKKALQGAIIGAVVL